MNFVKRVLMTSACVAVLTHGTNAADGHHDHNQHESRVYDQFASHYNVTEIEARVMNSMKDEFAKMDVRSKIEKEVSLMYGKMVNETIKMRELWDKAHLAEQKAWDEFDRMTTSEKLADILEDLEKVTALGDVFGKQESGTFSNVTVHFDTVNKEIGIKTDKVDAKGRPVLEWELNTQTGHTTTTKRAKDGQEVSITHKDVDPATLNSTKHAEKIQREVQESADLVDGLEKKQAEFVKQVNKTVAASGSDKEAPEVDLEQQKDLAFKILYFFLIFIFATFTLLYVFFKMTNSQEQEAIKRNNAKWRSTKSQEQTFFDFLAGQVDEDSLTAKHPYAAKAAAKSSGQMITSSTEGSEHTGFGANNLDHLANQERGRFDDLEMDHSNRNPYANLASFSNN